MIELFGGTVIDFLRHINLFPWPVHVDKAPEMDLRAPEIGKAVASDYDLVAMCEVWTPDLREALIDAANGQRGTLGKLANADKGGFTPNPLAFDTPTEALKVLGSGLLVLAAPALPISSSKPVIFETAGDRLMDADAWANKGFLQTNIKLGVGTLEVYTPIRFNDASPLTAPFVTNTTRPT